MASRQPMQPRNSSSEVLVVLALWDGHSDPWASSPLTLNANSKFPTEVHQLLHFLPLSFWKSFDLCRLIAQKPGSNRVRVDTHGENFSLGLGGSRVTKLPNTAALSRL